MKSIKILIAGAMVMLVTSALTGCASEQSASSVGAQRIAEAQEMIKTVTLSLTQIEDEKDIVVRLSLNNPEKKPITSVEAWLAYNPSVLEGGSIDTNNTPFEMVAPYINGFDQAFGLVMLGRSNSEPISDKEITVADIHFKRIGEGAAMIEAYDYRQDLEGHTSANMMVDGTPFNILLKPETPLVIINK